MSNTRKSPSNTPDRPVSPEPAANVANRADPLLTVVVPVYNVAGYLRECLDSILGQTYRNLEIIVVDDGSTDESPEIIARYAADDSRIRVLSQATAGPGAARNAALAQATGAYVTFADSDDVVAPDAYALLMGTLRRSHSDLAVAAYSRLRGSQSWVPYWVRRLHTQNRVGIKIQDCPDAFKNVMPWNKVWRREFFERAVGKWPEGIRYEDQEVSVRSYLSARQFDLISRPVYFWRIREDGSSITQGKDSIDDLRDRAAVSIRSAELIRADDRAVLRDPWFAKLLDFDLGQYVDLVPDTGPDYWELLRDTVVRLAAAGGDGWWKHAHVRMQFCLRALIADDRAACLRALAWTDAHGSGYSLEPAGGTFRVTGPALADYTAAGPGRAGLPSAIPDVRIVPELVTLYTGITGVTWTAPTVVRIAGYAYFRSEGTHEPGPPVLELVDSATGERIPLPARRSTVPRGWRPDTEVRDTSGDGFVATCEVGRILDRLATAPSTTWRLEISRELMGATMTNTVRECEDDGAAAVLGVSGWGAGGTRVALRFDPIDGLVFRAPSQSVLATSLSVHDRTLDVVLAMPTTKAPIVAVRVSHSAAGLGASAKVSAGRAEALSDGLPPAGRRTAAVLSATVSLPVLPPQARLSGDTVNWTLRAIDARGRAHRISYPDGTWQLADRSRGACAPLRLDTTRGGHAQLLETPVRAIAETLEPETLDPEFTGQAVRLSGRFTAPAGIAQPRFRLLGTGPADGIVVEPGASSVDRGAGMFSVVFSAESDVPRVPAGAPTADVPTGAVANVAAPTADVLERPTTADPTLPTSGILTAPGVPSGGYRLQIGVAPADDPEAPPTWHGIEVGQDLLPQLPATVDTSVAALTFTRTRARGNVWCRVDPPLRAGERGRFHRTRELRAALARAQEKGLLDAVLVDVVGCGTGALDAGAGQGTRRYWAVAHSDEGVPDGTVPVLRESPAYLHLLARACTVIIDHDTPWGYRSQPGQRVVRTASDLPEA